jgi:5-oxoprolinase (ATP-hydrolysing)
MWEFWIDRGGTFTDIVARQPDGKLIIHKLLSEDPDRYRDAAVWGIREILNISPTERIPIEDIQAIKMGTTIATNALLERQGARTLLVITQGFGDALRIGYQNRPDIFALHIVLPELLYEQVIEVEERCTATGEILTPLNLASLQPQLIAAYESGIGSCAIVLMHGYKYPQHEQQVAKLAREIGFTQVSVSHQVSPLIKLVSRGDTTVVDAYLSPILRQYVDRVVRELTAVDDPSSPTISTLPCLQFMQSNGGLVAANRFQGKDSILSGPAGGIVGAVQTSLEAGCDRIITFDMGGTSTDVAHYRGEYERDFDTEVAGVRLRAPMMAIHTVAAGGGSIVSFENHRYRVGPASAGAHPGPAAYGKGGPLTVTDCNVLVGKLQPEFFPHLFGKDGKQPLDVATVRAKFQELTDRIGDGRTPEAVAAGFLEIGIDKMAAAIKKISLQRGYDLSNYTLCCFGGAGGQHACLLADALGMERVLIHPYAGVLSAYGMGLADVRVLKEVSLESPLLEVNSSDGIPNALKATCDLLMAEGLGELTAQNLHAIEPEVIRKAHLRYRGSDAALIVEVADSGAMVAQFEELHRQRYGFITPDREIMVGAVTVELILPNGTISASKINRRSHGQPTPISHVSIYSIDPYNPGNYGWHDTPVYQRSDLQPGAKICGAAIIVESTGTNIIEPTWEVTVDDLQNLILTKSHHSPVIDLITSAPSEIKSSIDHPKFSSSQPDPVQLEIFNNLFRAIAEEMGITLQNTSSSVNIKERLDFSCAIFDRGGNLVANAPHIPVHLGSMSETVQALMRDRGNNIKPGDVYVSNNPYNGGTHLPDITVITPVFVPHDRSADAIPIFYVAARGHHADIGGITPGSMPPQSQDIEAEGILIDNFLLVDRGEFKQSELLTILNSSSYPARNPSQNIADLQAQIAANERGVQELLKTINRYGLEIVCNYMKHIQDNAEMAVRQVISQLKDGEFTCELDDGNKIRVAITINRQTQTAKIDFTGTSAQVQTNFNAPTAVCKAAVLYVFRTLVTDDIPLNAGCLQPLEIILPPGCMLAPTYPAAVVAGNVETSQAITDALYAALGIMAGSQGTMNNFTFGNEKYQYYETICGGSGAGKNFSGTDAVQTHMTNSRLTDPEVLESRFPVLVENFSIRPNSGGEGRYSGGNGVKRQIRFLETMQAGILSSRRKITPAGLAGGSSGQVGKNYILRSDGSIAILSSNATVTMRSGDIFTIETPGGGGYGAKMRSAE